MKTYSSKISRLILLCFSTLLFIACDAYRPNIQQKPIKFDQQRKELTQEYLRTRYELEGKSVQINQVLPEDPKSQVRSAAQRHEAG